MSWWKQMTVILALALAGTAVSALLTERPEVLTPSEDPFARSADEVAAMTGFIWVDARKPAAFRENPIEGAVNLSLDEWEPGFFALMDAWQPDQPIVVYCDGESCALSREVAERLRMELGQDSVYWLDGGLGAWRSRVEAAP